MVKKIDKFYVTTPIYYVNSIPHCGSLYSTLLADVASRFNKNILGKQTFFLTGVDEHGEKVLSAAKAEALPVQQFVDSLVEKYKAVWKLYEFDYTFFMRTTAEAHKKLVLQWIETCLQNGELYKADYHGLYCVPCETFVLENSLLDKEKLNCPDCQRGLKSISEESYFFKLSNYQTKLLDFYAENPDFIMPLERRNEVLNFVQAGLKDLSVSRLLLEWGIKFPRDSQHTVYVWVDALLNYLSALTTNFKEENSQLLTFWPPDLQIIGKDILRFHAVYWIAFCMAVGLNLPKKLLVHGWIKIDSKKMSKSLGNAVDPLLLAEKYGVEEVRYFFTRKISLTHDFDFSIELLEATINSDLVGDLGNLLNRVLSLALNSGFEVVRLNQSSKKLDILENYLFVFYFEVLAEILQYFEAGFFYKALDKIFELLSKINAYFHNSAPWHLFKKNELEEFNKVIYCTLFVLKNSAILLLPVLPNKMQTLLAALGFDLNKIINLKVELESKALDIEFKLKKIELLFNKIDKGANMENKNLNTEILEKNSVKNIAIADFAKVELRVGLISKCEEISESNKLLKLEVDFGTFGKRQILSAVRASYEPEELLGKLGLFVCNLEPKAICGYLSEGMMLFAEKNGKAIMTTVSENVQPGALVK